MVENVYTLSKFFAGAGVIFIASLAVRGYARANNPTYIKFIKTLTKAQRAYNDESKEALLKYDFEFWAWPADFHVLSLERYLFFKFRIFWLKDNCKKFSLLFIKSDYILCQHQRRLLSFGQNIRDRNNNLLY